MGGWMWKVPSSEEEGEYGVKESVEGIWKRDVDGEGGEEREFWEERYGDDWFFFFGKEAGWEDGERVWKGEAVWRAEEKDGAGTWKDGGPRCQVKAVGADEVEECLERGGEQVVRNGWAVSGG